MDGRGISGGPTPVLAIRTTPLPPVEQPARENAQSLPFDPWSGYEEGPQARSVSCRECGHLHPVSFKATDTVCPRCNDAISLLDYDIRERWDGELRTQGDIRIHEKGIVKGIKVTCSNLLIEGTFEGSVDCEGDVVIRRHGRIGSVKCRRLLVEERAEVEFTELVEAEAVVIDGLVRGEIACAGPLTLEPHARLNGDIQARSLVIKTGARHCGRIKTAAGSK